MWLRRQHRSLHPRFQESLQGYVMLVSGHFQGFCRDLYTECFQNCAAVVSAAMRTTIQAQFAARLALDTGDPTIKSIRSDFERFGFRLDLREPPQEIRKSWLIWLT